MFDILCYKICTVCISSSRSIQSSTSLVIADFIKVVLSMCAESDVIAIASYHCMNG